MNKCHVPKPNLGHNWVERINYTPPNRGHSSTPIPGCTEEFGTWHTHKSSWSWLHTFLGMTVSEPKQLKPITPAPNSEALNDLKENHLGRTLHQGRALATHWIMRRPGTALRSGKPMYITSHSFLPSLLHHPPCNFFLPSLRHFYCRHNQTL